MSDRDTKVSNRVADRIYDLWKMDRSRIVIEFEECSSCYTQPLHRDARNRVHLKVCGSSVTELETLLYHEGAHVYLFYLGYPPADFPNNRLDILADYYAYRLEAEIRESKSGIDKSKQLDMISERLFLLRTSPGIQAMLDGIKTS